jgi:hypothetical protein
MRRFELEALPMGVPRSGYTGAFSPTVERVIRQLVSGKILHLYSGSSLIGEVRVDIAHENATHKMTVEDYLSQDGDEKWDWILLDPPYDISNPRRKLKDCVLQAPLSVNVPLRRKFRLYCQHHTQNVLWLDKCAPLIRGFRREKLWLVIPLWFEHVRVLSWLKKEMEPLL